MFFQTGGGQGGSVVGAENSSAKKFATIKGTLGASGAMPKSIAASLGIIYLSAESSADEISKTARPLVNVNGTDYAYFARAEAKDQSGAVIATATGTFGALGTAAERSFEIPLEIGKVWTVICGVKDCASGAEVYADSMQKEITVDEPILNSVFYPKPTSKGTGSFSLDISFEDPIKSVDAECSSADWNGVLAAGASGTEKVLASDSINSGNYDVALKFLDESGAAVYECVQTICVFDNMKSDTWIPDGSACIASDGTLHVDGAIVKEFLSSVIYVGKPASLAAREDVRADDANGGGPWEPLESLTEAARRISLYGRGGDYKIYVSGTVTGPQEIPAALVAAKAKSVTILGLTGLDGNKKPRDSLDAEQSGRALEIKTSVPVILQNLRVTGGLHESDVPVAGGAGIYLGGSADLTLAGDVVVEQNHAKWYAGGIFASGGASLKIKGAVTVYGNTHGASASTAASNLYLSSGAKIQILGSLKTTDASGERKSKIGISCDDAPTHTEPLVFTQDYKSKNPSVSPIEYFYGDKYGVAAAASGEAALCVSGGSASLEDFYDDITISIDKTLSAKDIAEKKFTFSSNASDVSYTFSVTYHGETLPQSYYTTGTDSVTLLDVPVGSYMICVTAVCGGKTYGGEFEVAIIDALVPQGAGGSSLADSMLDPSVTNLEVFFENDYKAATPELPDEEKEASGYYSWNSYSSKWEKEFACVVPAGKTLTLMAEKPVTVNCNSTYHMFDVSGTLVIGKNVTVYGGLHHNVINVNSGGTLVLDGGTITRGIGGGAIWSAVTVYSGGKFVMKDGLMTENYVRGAVRVEDGGRFDMTGGEISGNVGESTGGVLVSAGGVFVKSGGIVKDNTRSGSPSQMVIKAGGKYGPSESGLITYDAETEVTDEF